MRHLEYPERLQALNLFPQQYRRLRGDLITTRKIIRGDMGVHLQEKFQLRNAARRGHALTLQKPHACKLSTKYCLSKRVINDWRNLPADVVEEVDDRKFKLKLDCWLKDRWEVDKL